MTVLHLISSGGYYGAENVLVLLSRVLKQRGWRCIIGAFQSTADGHAEIVARARNAGIETEVIRCKGRVDLRALERLKHILKQHNVDMLHAHGYKTDFYGYWAARSARGAALVSTCHAWQGKELSLRTYAALDRWLLRHFDQVAAVSDVLSAELANAGVPQNKIAVISNGIEVSRFRDAEASLRQEFDGDQSKWIGLVGRLAPEKGGDILLRAARIVLVDYPDAKFVFIGGGPMRATWEALAEQLGVASNVIWVGVRDDMPQVYASLDIVTLPSYNEGLPMCLLEAMASAKPVIATPVGSVDKLVLPDHTGLLVQTGDDRGLAKAILRLLSNPEEARQMGENGRACVNARFSPETMADKYVQLYNDAWSSRARSRQRSFRRGCN